MCVMSRRARVIVVEGGVKRKETLTFEQHTYRNFNKRLCMKFLSSEIMPLA